MGMISARTTIQHWTRRQFLKNSLAAGAALGFPAIIPSSVLGQGAPSKRLNILQIGCGRIAEGMDMSDAIRLAPALRGELRHDEPMAKHVSWRAGGRARPHREAKAEAARLGVQDFLLDVPEAPAQPGIILFRQRTPRWSEEQVERYWKRYGMVLVTNFRAFALIGKSPTGQPSILESFTLADSEGEFWRSTLHPRQAAAQHGERMLEYLKRVLLHNAPLAAPQVSM